MKNFFSRIFKCKKNCSNNVDCVLEITDDGVTIPISMSIPKDLVPKMYEIIHEIYSKGDTYKNRNKKMWETCRDIVTEVEPYLNTNVD